MKGQLFLRARTPVATSKLYGASAYFSSSLPGDRLPQLRQLLAKHKTDRVIRVLETHNGLTGLIAETASVEVDGQTIEFDGMWSSSLTASAACGKPDIETVDTTARLAMVTETLDVTSKPLIYDADTGGQPEIFRFTVRSLEKLGASMAIIEDKAGLKQNSLFGTERKQELATIEDFVAKIKAGQEAKENPDFMITARLEALIAGHGQAEALKRAVAFTEAGADAVMIHSKEKSPAEVLEFLQAYHKAMGPDAVPVVAVPTTYNTITEAELKDAGVSICIYANHMLRAAYPSMVKTAESILRNSRSHEADSDLLPVKKVITMIDENPLNPGLAKPKVAAAGSRSFSTSTRRSFGTMATPLSYINENPLGTTTTTRRRFSTTTTPTGNFSTAAKAKLTTNPNASSPAPKPSPASAPPAQEAPAVQEAVSPLALYEYTRTLGVNYFCGVPDSLLKPFCAVVADECSTHLISANEGSAIATAAGYHLATGEVPLVYLQNSGLGNAVNPIMSLAHNEVYATPMVVMIGWRGCPGHKDEPQHVVQGRQTVAQLESLGLETVIMPAEPDAAFKAMADAVDTAKRMSQPVALLVPPKIFSPYKKAVPAGIEYGADYAAKPTREEAIGTILEGLVGPRDAVVCTTGFTSREVYEMRAALGQPHEQDFLCVGSMGHAIAIAQGIAVAQPDRTVWCLDGDGAAMMHTGNMVTSGALSKQLSPETGGNGLSNLRHVVLNNRVHDSVGSQPTAAAFEGAVDFVGLAESAGYAAASTAATAAEIVPAVERSLERASQLKGPMFLEVQLKLGTRGDLGRPKTTTLDAKKALMSFLAK